MRGKMPKSVKIALWLFFMSLLLGVIWRVSQEGAFIRSFLVHAKDLDHKAIILAAPIVKMVTVLISGVTSLVLIIALAFGKSWARKTLILIVILQMLMFGLGLVGCIFGLSSWQLQEILRRIKWWAWIDFAVKLLVAVSLYMHDARAWYRADATLENKWKNRLQCMVFWALVIVVGGVCGIVQNAADRIPIKARSKFPHLRVAELEARADQGDAPSMWRLGNWERNGWLGEKHPDKAVEWYRKAADLGDRSALNDLGDCYEKGIGTETNIEEAVACWMKAAEKRHGWAACKVAIRYQKDKKQKEAFEWFRKSADIGSDYGCCKLGECYEKGWGTETNAALSAKWFLQGARRNHSWGMEKTGDFYRDGYGVEKDLVKAREWYEKAARRGNKNAQKKLDALTADKKKDEAAK